MNIAKNSVVSFHYTLTNETGQEIDSSKGKDPLSYLHGSGNIIPGLENELEGKMSNDAFKVEIAPEDGYGVVHDELVQVVPREAFEGVDKIEVGMQFQVQGEGGHAQMITIAEINGDEIKVDGNHPLAGEKLHFDVSIVSVREATQEEIDHGHVH